MTDSLMMTGIFLGGAIAGAVVCYAFAARSGRAKKHEYTGQQLDRLYAPLYFLLKQNERLFELSLEILKDRPEYFDASSWDSESATQDTLRLESTQSIQLSNSYTDQVAENNDAILELFRDNYALADIEDMESFSTFAIELLRLTRAIKDKRTTKMPVNVYKLANDISYSQTRFLERVDEQFNTKKAMSGS